MLKKKIERHNIVFLFKMKDELYWAVYLCKTSPPQDRVKTEQKKWAERYISSLKSEPDKNLSPAKYEASSCSVMLKSKKSSRKSKSLKSQRRIQKRIQKSKRRSKRSKRSKRRTQKKLKVEEVNN